MGPAPAPDLDRVASEKLRYVVEAELPRPIAQEFARLRGAHGAGAGPFAANLLGHVLRHAVNVLAATRAIHGWPPELRRRFADELKKPQSLGQMLGLANALADGVDARLAAQLRDRATRDALDAAVTLRNAVLKKGEVEAGDALKRAVIAIVRELLFLREQPLVEVISCKERAGAHVMEVRFLVGTEDTERGRVESDLALAPGRVYLLDPIARTALDLHPLYAIAPGDGKAHPPLAWLSRAANPPEYEAGDGKAHKVAPLTGDVAELVEGRARKPLVARFLTIRGGAQDVGRRQLRPGDVVDGRYRVVAMIGEGGMAHVYEIEDRVDARAYALKVLPYEYIRDRTMVTRFRREAEETRALDHPNVMPTLRYGEDFGDNFLVMPLAAGWPLPDGKRALDASQLPRPMPIADAIAIAKQAADALHYVHGKGVVHRDLKPRNLLLDADRVVRLSDFGVAGTAEAMTLTMTGLGVGTPEYMAPEQIEGAEPAPAADLYGLGAVLFELLTGAPPYAGKTPLAIMQAVSTRPVPDPRKVRPEIPPALGKLVRTLLAKDPADRPRSAAEVYRALSEEAPDLPEDEPAPAGEALREGELVGDVRVGRLVVRTPASTFHEARQLGKGRAVTLRVWTADLELHKRFAWARSRLRHTAIVQTLDLVDDPVRGFHVLLEALPPVTLHSLGTLAFTRAIRLVRQLAGATLDAATEGLVLDLDPARLYVATERESDYIKVLELVPAEDGRAPDADLRALVALLVQLIGGAAIPTWVEDALRSDSLDALIAALDHGSGPPSLPQPSPAGAWLELLATGARLELHQDRELVIGRSIGCDLVVDEPMASQRHTLIRYSASRARHVLIDLGSSNGTLVNGKRVEQHVLEDGDELSIGGFRARFGCRDEAPRPVAGRYRLGGARREDALGAWFDATDVSLDRALCVRVFSPAVAAHPDRIRRYAKIVIGLAAVNPLMIQHVFDVVALPDASYAVTERLEGDDLEAVIARDGPLDVDRAARLVVELARALADVHRVGLFHGHLVPRSVIVSEHRGHPARMIDFGVHELLYGAPDHRQTPEALVTITAAAPELRAGKAWPGVSTDVYGLGVVLYTALTGRLPDEPAAAPSTTRPEISPALDAVVLRALAQDPAERFATTVELAEMLARADGRAAPPSGPGPGTVLAGGKLRLEALVCESRVALFFDAVEPERDRQATVRVLHPTLASDRDETATARRFAWATAAIKHPGVLHTYDVETDPACGLYVVMEPRNGGSLEESSERKGRWRSAAR